MLSPADRPPWHAVHLSPVSTPALASFCARPLSPRRTASLSSSAHCYSDIETGAMNSNVSSCLLRPSKVLRVVSRSTSVGYVWNAIVIANERVSVVTAPVVVLLPTQTYCVVDSSYVNTAAHTSRGRLLRGRHFFVPRSGVCPHLTTWTRITSRDERSFAELHVDGLQVLV